MRVGGGTCLPMRAFNKKGKGQSKQHQKLQKLDRDWRAAATDIAPYTYPTRTTRTCANPRTRSALWGRARACPQVPRKTCTLCSACSRGEALALRAGPPVLGRAVIEQLHHLLGSK